MGRGKLPVHSVQQTFHYHIADSRVAAALPYYTTQPLCAHQVMRYALSRQGWNRHSTSPPLHRLTIANVGLMNIIKA